MRIEVFNFLEARKEQILERLKGQVDRESAAYGRMSDAALHALVEHLFDRYTDTIVTDEVDSTDPLYQALSRLVAAGGPPIGELFELPLVLTTVIRQRLAEEYAPAAGESKLAAFNAALDETERAGWRVMGAVIDAFQDHLRGRTETNRPADMPSELGPDLSRFLFEAESPGIRDEPAD